MSNSKWFQTESKVFSLSSIGYLPSNTTERSQRFTACGRWSGIHAQDYGRSWMMGEYQNIALIPFQSPYNMNIVHDHGTSHITIYFPPITQEIFPLSLPERIVWRVLVCLVNTNPGPETETDAFLTWYPLIARLCQYTSHQGSCRRLVLEKVPSEGS